MNESYLITNGLLFIEWELTNFLWIRINETLIITNLKGVCLNYNRIGNPINIEVIGLFGRLQKSFSTSPVATLMSEKLGAPDIFSDKFQLKITAKEIATGLTPSLSFPTTPRFKSIQTTKNLTLHLMIPEFNKHNRYE